MPIHFRNIPVHEPYTFDSIGNHWDQPAIIRPDGYPFYHYLQTEKGRGCVDVAGKKYVLEEGEGLLIPPFLRHSYSGQSDKWITAFATFTGTAASCIPQMLGQQGILPVDRETGLKMQTAIDSIMDDWDDLSLDAFALSVRCYYLLLTFTDQVHSRRLAEEPLYQRYVAPTIKEIETSYDTPVTVQELSQKVYVTPQYLSRLFQRFAGCSVYEYLTNYRISKARELLVQDRHAEVQTIAGQVGFADTSHFIAMFKKVCGVTPLEFRKLN